jgi:hypothetical protein
MTIKKHNKKKGIPAGLLSDLEKRGGNVPKVMQKKGLYFSRTIPKISVVLTQCDEMINRTYVCRLNHHFDNVGSFYHPVSITLADIEMIKPALESPIFLPLQYIEEGSFFHPLPTAGRTCREKACLLQNPYRGLQRRVSGGNDLSDLRGLKDHRDQATERLGCQPSVLEGVDHRVSDHHSVGCCRIRTESAAADEGTGPLFRVGKNPVPRTEVGIGPVRLDPDEFGEGFIVKERVIDRDSTDLDTKKLTPRSSLK